MLTRWQFWVLTVLAVAQAALVAANMLWFTENRKVQVDVNQRAQQIMQAAPMEQLTRDIALALAQLAARTQDEQVRSMLRSAGIAVQLSEPAAAPEKRP